MPTNKSSKLSITVVRNEPTDVQSIDRKTRTKSIPAISVIYAAALLGLEAEIVQVETQLSSGMVRFYLVGLPSRVVSESIDKQKRPFEVLKQLSFGTYNQSLSPANVHKEGNGYDLPIAIGLLAMSRQISTEKLSSIMMMAELALDGRMRPVQGVFHGGIKSKKSGIILSGGCP